MCLLESLEPLSVDFATHEVGCSAGGRLAGTGQDGTGPRVLICGLWGKTLQFHPCVELIDLVFNIGKQHGQKAVAFWLRVAGRIQFTGGKVVEQIHRPPDLLHKW